ncbi:MAG: DUF2939 domain-containing protein [Hyphomicrobium sp.]|nr:DUF2939 domain-containing protein [Hyphomicrobium sp.]
MTKLLLKIAVMATLAAIYVAAPFMTAWSIREAVRNGDTAYLERAIDWPSIRLTLTPSLTQLAVSGTDSEDAHANDQNPPSLWQRLKTYVSQGAVASAVETSITPEGLTRLFTLRKAYRQYVSGDPDDANLAVTERMRRAWARVKRAEFTSLTRFEVDMTDKLDETRMYLAKLELTGVGWIMKELRVQNVQAVNGGTAAHRFFDPTPRLPATQLAPTTSIDGGTASTQRQAGFFARIIAAAQPRS